MPERVHATNQVLLGTINQSYITSSTFCWNIAGSPSLNVILTGRSAGPHTEHWRYAFYPALFLPTLLIPQPKAAPWKFTLFSASSRQGGGLNAKDGIRFKRGPMDGIRQEHVYTTEAQLQQFFCAKQGIRNSFPEFTTIIQPPSGFLQQVHRDAERPTKRVAAHVQIKEIGWAEPQEAVFTKYKIDLVHQVTLAHCNVGFRLGIQTFACNLV